MIFRICPMDNPSRDIRPTEEQLLKALPFCDGEPSSSKTAPICGICGKMFKNRGSMRFHMQRAHKTEFVDGENGTLDSILGFRRDGNCTIGGGRNGEAMRFHCPLEGCRRRDDAQQHFASAKLLIQHFQKKHTEKRHRCSECSARFALARDLRYHQKKVCPNAKRAIRAETSIPKNSNLRLPTTTEATPNAAQSAVKVFLVPVKFDQRIRFRRIFPRLAAVERRTVATQTGDHRPQNVYSLRQQMAPQFCAESSPSSDTFYTETAAVGTPSQFAHQMHKNNLFGELLQFQNADCQTNYQPKTTTIDFAAQWPSGAIPSGVNSFCSSSIYLPPLVTSSTQTAQMLHQCSQTIADDPPTATAGHNAKCSLLLQTQNSAATQTYAFSQRLPPLMGDGMDSTNCCWATASLDEAALCSSVSAQTDASWAKEMPRVG